MRCWDCHYCSPSGGPGEYKCTAHHKFGTFDPDCPACSHFASDDAEGDCDMCTYYDSGPYVWNTSGKCTITGRKVNGNSPSCSRYVPD